MSKDANNESECTYCNKPFSNKFQESLGKYLTACNHIYCVGCCNKLQKFGSISCPSCNKKTKLPAKGIDALKTLTAKEIKQQGPARTTRCEECQFNKSKFYCVECNMDICQICDENIVHKAKIFAHHRRVDPAERKDMIALKKKEDDEYRRARHAERLAMGDQAEAEEDSGDEEGLYCTVCMTNVIDENEHRGHKLVPLSQLAEVLAEAKAKQKAADDAEAAEKKKQEERLMQVSSAAASKKERDLQRDLEEKRAKTRANDAKLEKMKREAENRKNQLSNYQAKIEAEKAARDRQREEFEARLKDNSLSEEARIQAIKEFERQAEDSARASEARNAAYAANLRRAELEAERKAQNLIEAQRKFALEAERKEQKFKEYQDKMRQEAEIRQRKLFEYEEKLKAANVGAREREKRLEEFNMKMMASVANKQKQQLQFEQKLERAQREAKNKEMKLRQQQRRKEADLQNRQKERNDIDAKLLDEANKRNAMLAKYDAQLQGKCSDEKRFQQLKEYSRKLRLQAQKQENATLGYQRNEKLATLAAGARQAAQKKLVADLETELVKRENTLTELEAKMDEKKYSFADREALLGSFERQFRRQELLRDPKTNRLTKAIDSISQRAAGQLYCFNSQVCYFAEDSTHTNHNSLNLGSVLNANFKESQSTAFQANLYLSVSREVNAQLSFFDIVKADTITRLAALDQYEKTAAETFITLSPAEIAAKVAEYMRSLSLATFVKDSANETDLQVALLRDVPAGDERKYALEMVTVQMRQELEVFEKQMTKKIVELATTTLSAHEKQVKLIEFEQEVRVQAKARYIDLLAENAETLRLEVYDKGVYMCTKNRTLTTFREDPALFDGGTAVTPISFLKAASANEDLRLQEYKEALLAEAANRAEQREAYERRLQEELHQRSSELEITKSNAPAALLGDNVRLRSTALALEFDYKTLGYAKMMDQKKKSQVESKVLSETAHQEFKESKAMVEAVLTILENKTTSTNVDVDLSIESMFQLEKLLRLNDEEKEYLKTIYADKLGDAKVLCKQHDEVNFMCLDCKVSVHDVENSCHARHTTCTVADFHKNAEIRTAKSKQFLDGLKQSNAMKLDKLNEYSEQVKKSNATPEQIVKALANYDSKFRANFMGKRLERSGRLRMMQVKSWSPQEQAAYFEKYQQELQAEGKLIETNLAKFRRVLEVQNVAPDVINSKLDSLEVAMCLSNEAVLTRVNDYLVYLQKLGYSVQGQDALMTAYSNRLIANATELKNEMRQFTLKVLSDPKLTAQHRKIKLTAFLRKLKMQQQVCENQIFRYILFFHCLVDFLTL
jgi:hypothetical protein